ncbi:hypothetical protein SDC9_153120 [bioreactor metagenome]|uniref:Uncharacterized protein n=1 Tax=bioreactor metagenome TaxID=1076179 RepID=A0A645EWQ7_9ZZZZ
MKALTAEINNVWFPTPISRGIAYTAPPNSLFARVWSTTIRLYLTHAMIEDATWAISINTPHIIDQTSIVNVGSTLMVALARRV